MALQTFDQAMQHDREPFIVFIDDSEFHGYAASTRIDRKTVPDGWYVYDLRHDDYDTNGNETYEENCTDDMPTYAKEQLEYLEEKEELI